MKTGTVTDLLIERDRLRTMRQVVHGLMRTDFLGYAVTVEEEADRLEGEDYRVLGIRCVVCKEDKGVVVKVGGTGIPETCLCTVCDELVEQWARERTDAVQD